MKNTEFDKLLASIFSGDNDGKKFEVFCEWFLKNDPYWKNQFSKIWMWNEWPERWGRDCGIDLIAQRKDGRLCGIQVKCYSPNTTISKRDIDTFLSETSRPQIADRLLLATTNRLSSNAQRTCSHQEKPVRFFLKSNFEKADLVYPDDIKKIYKTTPKQPPRPEPHQLAAIEAVSNKLKKVDRGQLIMACGTGKTFTTLWIKEALKSRKTLVLVPSLNLLSQTLMSWNFGSKFSFDSLCVCSDPSVSQAEKDDIRFDELPFPVTTSPPEIQHFLRQKTDGVVFCTYQSTDRIAEAQKTADVPSFDLIIADEAHRCAGSARSDAAFKLVLDTNAIRSQKRLFTTATPRFFSNRIVKKARSRNIEIHSMNDQTKFGSVLHTLSFGSAIENKLLNDYRVVVIGVDKETIRKTIEEKELLLWNLENIEDARSIATKIGLLKAIRDYDLKRMISFHGRVKSARMFSKQIGDLITLLGEHSKPTGSIWSSFVSGAMSTSKRMAQIDRLNHLDENQRGLLANARCLTEGVDVPALNGVAFVDPKRSQIDIVQAVGRAIRLDRTAQEQTVGTIVVPVFIGEGESIDTKIQNSDFKPVWDVLKALRAHDDILASNLDSLRSKLSTSGEISKVIGPEKLVFDLPKHINPNFSESLYTIALENSTEDWFSRYGYLKQFSDKFGHSRPTKNYKTDDGFTLGSWVTTQRQHKDHLTCDKISLLEQLPDWSWNTRDEKWELAIALLKRFHHEKSHLDVPLRFEMDGIKIGAWVRRMRNLYQLHRLSEGRIKELEELDGWLWNSNEARFSFGYEKLVAYVRSQHSIPNISTVLTDGFRLGQWVGVQRSSYSNKKLSKERKDKLEEIPGWFWEPHDPFYEKLQILQSFQKKFGHLKPSRGEKYEGVDIARFIGWLRYLNKTGKISEDKKRSVEKINGWTWNTKVTEWNKKLSELTIFFNEHGHTHVKQIYRSKSGLQLGVWVNHQRHNKNKLLEDQIQSLEAFPDWFWGNTPKLTDESGVRDTFERYKAYIEDTGKVGISRNFVTADNYELGKKITNLRAVYRKGQLTKSTVELFDSIRGFYWESGATQRWNEAHEALIEYSHVFTGKMPKQSYVTADGKKLGSWVSTQKQFYKQGKLSDERIKALEAVRGWSWS